jgi:predicted Zn-dependent peptidase
MNQKRAEVRILKNGLKVIFEKRDMPILSMAFAVKQGGINETKAEKGISHFIEHMLFKGTLTKSAKELSESIEKVGGILNGLTEEEITAFWCKVPSNQALSSLEVLIDLVKNPKFDEKEIEKERKVIFEEMKMHRDSPSSYVSEKIKEMMYVGDFAVPLIGTLKSMNSIKREDLIKKFKQVYRSENMIFCAVGDGNISEICTLLEKSFSKSKGSSPKIKVITQNKQEIEQRAGIFQANLILGYHLSVKDKRQLYAAKILGASLIDGMSSRLWQEIRERRNLAYAIKGALCRGSLHAHQNIYVACMPENVEKVKTLILDEFKKVRDNLDEKELAKVKQQLIGNYKLSQEESDDRMVELLLVECIGELEEVYHYEEMISSITLEEVKKAADIKDYSFFALVPKR